MCVCIKKYNGYNYKRFSKTSKYKIDFRNWRINCIFQVCFCIIFFFFAQIINNYAAIIGQRIIGIRLELMLVFYV